MLVLRLKGMEMPKSCGDCKAFVCYRLYAEDAAGGEVRQRGLSADDLRRRAGELPRMGGGTDNNGRIEQEDRTVNEEEQKNGMIDVDGIDDGELTVNALRRLLRSKAIREVYAGRRSPEEDE